MVPKNAAERPHHTERFARFAWRENGSVVACGSRRCLSVTQPGARPNETARDERSPFDQTPPNQHPDATCHVAFDDADARVPVAEAFEVRADGSRRALEIWRIEPTETSDYFAVETSFSRDGKWLAVTHTAIGLGDGEPAIDVRSLDLRPAPRCR